MVFVFFKQKTAYEMRISDWSSDVCSSDLDYLVEVSRPPVEVKPAPIGETDLAIARHAAGYIRDGSVIQVGIGAVPDALTRLIADRRDLGGSEERREGQH